MEPSFFTINACNRCKKRKARCDANIPTCVPCQKSGSICEYTDTRTRSTHPRSFIHRLEEEVARLKQELESHSTLDVDAEDQANHGSHEGLPSVEADDRARCDAQARPDLIRLEPGGDAHFLGESSGMRLARTVLESAQQNAASFSSASHADRQPEGEPSNVSDGQPAAQSTSHAALPSWEIAMSLIEIFFNNYQVENPILIEHDFVATAKDYYHRTLNGGLSRDEDIWIKFMLNMVFSIAIGSLSRDNPDTRGFAQGFSSNAMADLSTIMHNKDLRTLQCLLLLLLASVLNSSSTPIWYISGLCMRMCIDLGFHSEKTIQASVKGLASADEVDSKRRLFWVTYTFDRSLSTILGRPSMLDDDKIDVDYPDCSLPASRKPQILHWLKLQRLQSEIVHRLYISHDDDSQPTSQKLDVEAWTADMARKLAAWDDGIMTVTESNGHDLDWWRYWLQYALLILYRPSPLRPKLDSHALKSCFAAAKNMVQLSFVRAHKGIADFTWLDLHYHYLSGITLLFLVWENTEARILAQNEWIAFKSCLVQWEVVLSRLATRWDRVSRARDVLVKVADATVNIVEEKMARPSTGMSQERTRNKGKERDRRRSIMEQLGSPGAQLPYDPTKSSNHSKDIAQRDSAGKARLAYAGPELCQPSHRSPNSIHQARLDARTWYDRAAEPQLASPLSPDRMQGQQASPTSWPQEPLDLEADNIFMTQSLSNLLNDEIWSGFGTYDNSTTIPTGMFDYFPMPMAVPMPVLGVDFGMSGGSMVGRMDNNFTDSILNFRGTRDELRDVDTGGAEE